VFLLFALSNYGARLRFLSLRKLRISADWYVTFHARCNFSRAFRYFPASRNTCASKYSNDSSIEWFANVTRERAARKRCRVLTETRPMRMIFVALVFPGTRRAVPLEFVASIREKRRGTRATGVIALVYRRRDVYVRVHRRGGRLIYETCIDRRAVCIRQRARKWERPGVAARGKGYWLHGWS